ncbi:hypothetical protein N7462_010534 [Penicillium macrosclerotiorum]|uniref:uncharacterized protein n=1 Tax=Penicillium macrosclerotiorum TaxID=303699 RepID=UPI002546AFC6|nr:uncharacterized protein N7462_010534 [Penicillium macrosclerotiorum]KAJ5669464.1 hypothetical protein N7462_010534 [Penicillium macrosclerotiorum]
MSSNVSSAGITTDATTGERYIPSSLRADGSKRREIRVRPGYEPPEDVERYKNRAAAAWKNRGKGGVPGAESLNSEDKSLQGPSNKNAKRREAKRKAKEGENNDTPAEASEKKGANSDNWRVAAEKDQPTTKEPVEPVDPEAEREKKARNIKKKLRQARDLRDKKHEGAALLPEQLEKLIKIPELVRQLEALGFDSNGDKKETENENECPETA